MRLIYVVVVAVYMVFPLLFHQFAIVVVAVCVLLPPLFHPFVIA